jgi:2-phospho-L-lactate guanylyltransferase
MKGIRTIWALVPIKDFAAAKSRLAGALTPDECAALAEHMARDVLVALKNSRCIEKAIVLGKSPQADTLAKDCGCLSMTENSGGDLNQKLNTAVNQLNDSVDTLLLVPGDLPTLTATDIDELVQNQSAGLVVCPADQDGGTNALLITPPDAVPFRFGANSARAHLDAGRAANLRATEYRHQAFARDVDTTEDLLWFCRQTRTGHASRFLDESGIRQRLLSTPMAALG